MLTYSYPTQTLFLHLSRIAQASSALLTLQESAASPAKKQATKRNQLTPSTTPNKVPALSPDGEGTSISFIKWLASVTERVNQTMHYQFALARYSLFINPSSKIFI